MLFITAILRLRKYFIIKIYLNRHNCINCDFFISVQILFCHCFMMFMLNPEIETLEVFLLLLAPNVTNLMLVRLFKFKFFIFDLMELDDATSGKPMLCIEFIARDRCR